MRRFTAHDGYDNSLIFYFYIYMRIAFRVVKTGVKHGSGIYPKKVCILGLIMGIMGSGKVKL